MGAFRSDLEVWGDPIDHSLSPALHAAAYRCLGIDWTYGRRRVTEATFHAELIAGRDRLRGLSCTMPLKAKALAAADEHDRYSELTGAANTLLLGSGAIRAANTDVPGLARALRSGGIVGIDAARLLGAGATASSAVVALQLLGAGSVEIVARRPDRAAELVSLATELGVRARAVPFGSQEIDRVTVTIATLPTGARLGLEDEARLAERGGTLFDVAYAPWPSALARAWADHGTGPALSGKMMLLEQALLQVRLFVHGDVEVPLANETEVYRAMREALSAARDMGD